MLNAAFTEFRKDTASYLDKVENGETLIITRHGRPIAEVIPPSTIGKEKSWKRPFRRISERGISLSKEILKDRKKSP